MIENNLHTDTLEKKYGPIRAIVLRHDPFDCDGERIRETKLVDSDGVLRTYALTFLASNDRTEEFSKIDETIKEGGLIGRTFQRFGYAVIRNILCDLVVPLPAWMQNDMRVPQTTANARLIEFHAQKGDSAPLLYGTLIEIYSPDFETPRDLGKTLNDRDMWKEHIRTLHDKITQYLQVGAA